MILCGQVVLEQNSIALGKLGTGAGIGEEMVFDEEWRKYETGEFVNSYTIKALSDTFLLECTRDDWHKIELLIKNENLDYDFDILRKNLLYSYDQKKKWGALESRLSTKNSNT